MDFASIGANIGKQMMGGQSAYQDGFTRMAKELSDINLKQAQGDYYRSRGDVERQRASYQTPEYATKFAASLAGLNDAQAGDMENFTKSGTWGMNPAMPDEARQMTVAPTPKAQPEWATPDTLNKYNAGRAAHMLNLGATGDSNADQIMKAITGILGQGRIDSAIADPSKAAALGQAMAASEGKPLFNQNTNGVMQLFTGDERLNDVGRSAAKENLAQATNAYASAGSHNANAAKVRMETSPGQSTEGFTPGAIDAAAARYNMDGTLPPMGMGKEGALGRRTILNRAAELSGLSNISPDDQRINQIGNKANTAALSKIQQQQTMVGAFEKNFNKNADITLELSQKVDRTGVPILNKWINAGKRSIGGDPDLAAFDQAIKSASNEYAKIISGSMGNTAVAEGEIRSMESKLNAAQTPEQVSAVIALMQRETKNRMTAFDDEKAQLRGTMGIRGQSAQAPIGPQQPAPDRSPALANIPDAAILHLKSNPNLAPAFAAKYGKNATDAALGKVR